MCELYDFMRRLVAQVQGEDAGVATHPFLHRVSDAFFALAAHDGAEQD